MRIFMLVVAGIMVTAALVNLIDARDFHENAREMHAQFTYDRIENVLRILEATLPAKRLQIQDVFARMGSRVQLGAVAPTQLPPLPVDLLPLKAKLIPELVEQLAVDADCPPPHWQTLKQSDWHPLRFRQANQRCLVVYARLDDQTPVKIQLHAGPRRPARALQRHPYLLPILAIALMVVTWVVARMATKPLRQLSDAALRLAKNMDEPALSETQGPLEVRKAAQAFNTMQRSIVQHVQERSFLLGAIAHDLQTPLTRLRLRLEKVQTPALKAQLIADLNATQAMVQQGLDFARLSSEHLQTEPIEMVAFVQGILHDQQAQGRSCAQYLANTALPIMGSPHLLKRCLNNLLDNAFTYGTQVSVTLQASAGWLTCCISDHGPGIPPHAIDSMLEPFRRLEDSRSRHTGGSGLGLSIARLIAQKHGGQLQLTNQPAPATGLLATLRLPYPA